MIAVHARDVLKPAARQTPLDAPDEFRAALRAWFERQGKDYPWRRTSDPYAVLISEVMLQQTQIATVLGRGFYTRFLERFPDVESLAAAEDDVLLKTWEGLGYYRRARMLREAAKAVIKRHGGTFPADLDALLALPGIGRYTAGAVLSFAFDRPAPIVDGNVARVLSRLFDRADPIDAGPMQKWLWETAGQLLDYEHPRVFNSALMELGPNALPAGCAGLPVVPGGGILPDERAVEFAGEIEAPGHRGIDEHVAYVVHQGKVLLSRQGRGRREGMWRLPVREKSALSHLPLLHRRKYGITRYRVTLHVHQSPAWIPGEGEAWMELECLADLVIPPADRAALAAVLGEREEIT